MFSVPKLKQVNRKICFSFIIYDAIVVHDTGN